MIPGRAICEELPELAGASDRLRRVAELRETAEIELSNSSHEPRARVRIFPCGSGMAVQCLDEEGATSNGNGAGDEAHNEVRDGASSSEKRVERLRAYLGTLVEATNDAVIGFDEEFNVLSWNRGARNMLGYEEAEIVGRSAYELETVLQWILNPPFAGLSEAFQRAAPASLRSMMRLIAQWIMATPVSDSRS